MVFLLLGCVRVGLHHVGAELGLERGLGEGRGAVESKLNLIGEADDTGWGASEGARTHRVDGGSDRAARAGFDTRFVHGRDIVGALEGLGVGAVGGVDDPLDCGVREVRPGGLGDGDLGEGSGCIFGEGLGFGALDGTGEVGMRPSIRGTTKGQSVTISSRSKRGSRECVIQSAIGSYRHRRVKTLRHDNQFSRR